MRNFLIYPSTSFFVTILTYHRFRLCSKQPCQIQLFSLRLHSSLLEIRTYLELNWSELNIQAQSLKNFHLHVDIRKIETGEVQVINDKRVI